MAEMKSAKKENPKTSLGLFLKKAGGGGKGGRRSTKTGIRRV